MWTWLGNLFARATAPPGRASRSRLRPRLQVETLEDRCVPTVTYHGGALLAHVEVQGVYLGADWTSRANAAQAARLEGFLHDIVSGPYMDLLTTAGYGVGRGSADRGVTLPASLDKQKELSDGDIQGYLQAAIRKGVLRPPDPERLYVIFVEPDVVVRTLDGALSRTDFLGYHGAFDGVDAAGRDTDIRYAVISYPGGRAGNAAVAGLSALNDQTEVASHEIAESATDPDVNYKVIGWYDDTQNGEIADLVNQEYVTLDGYTVQRVADPSGQAMTPAVAAPLVPASFVLLSSGRLYEHTAAGWIGLADGIASVSDQAIDNSGRAVVDVVTAGGLAYEYHDGSGWVYLRDQVRQACAGQGVSYVLLANGQVAEYRDDTGWGVGALAIGAASIDAGTDRLGVNCVAVVYRTGALAEYSDATGWHTLGTDVQAVSAGAMGNLAVLRRDGRALSYAAAGTWTLLAANAAQVSAGTDVGGAPLFAVVTRTAELLEYGGGVVHPLASGVQQVSAARNGLLDVVLKNGNAYEHTAAGWTSLCASARWAG